VKKCDECSETFNWNDDVVNVENRYFHRKCVDIVPVGYVAYVDGEFLGEVEYEDMACLILNDGDYVEGEE